MRSKTQGRYDPGVTCVKVFSPFTARRNQFSAEDTKKGAALRLPLQSIGR